LEVTFIEQNLRNSLQNTGLGFQIIKLVIMCEQKRKKGLGVQYISQGK